MKKENRAEKSAPPVPAADEDTPPWRTGNESPASSVVPVEPAVEPAASAVPGPEKKAAKEEEALVLDDTPAVPRRAPRPKQPRPAAPAAEPPPPPPPDDEDFGMVQPEFGF